MYVAVKGGEKAIEHAHRLQAALRRGKPEVAELRCEQINQQLGLAVDRVMTEGGLYDPELAALAIKQASGDLVEAIFLLRAYRTTLPRLADSQPLSMQSMRCERRISAIYKDIPGGQVLGPTYDYTHRLLDFMLLADGQVPDVPPGDQPLPEAVPTVFSLLEQEQLAVPEPENETPAQDITREPPEYPASRSARLQQLARGDEGFLLALGYSTQRGYGRNHPFVGEIRSGYVDVEIVPEELGFAVSIGEMVLTACEMVNGFTDQVDPPAFTRGFGLVFGRGERKAMAMALMDRALQAPEWQETIDGPAQDEEFVLAHADNVEAAGFVSHLKLPHYVDFQAELALLHQVRATREAKKNA